MKIFLQRILHNILKVWPQQKLTKMLMTLHGEMLDRGLPFLCTPHVPTPYSLLYKVHRFVKDSGHTSLLLGVWLFCWWLVVVLRQFCFVTPDALKLIAILLP